MNKESDPFLHRLKAWLTLWIVVFMTLFPSLSHGSLSQTEERFIFTQKYTADDLDVRYVRQKNGAALDVMTEVQYNVAYPPHLPWKVIDAAGQTTTFTWNANGQILTITNALNEVVTYAYETNPAANGYGRPLTITGPVAGATLAFTYDAFDRVLTSTDSAGHTLTFLYDALDRPKRVTFPDATFEETTYTAMDATKMRDRLGRISQTKFNALRQPVFAEDALGRKIGRAHV